MPKIIDPALKVEARRLRRDEHCGLEVIAARTGISKATLSVFLRDLPLSEEVHRAKAQEGALLTTSARWGADRVQAVAATRTTMDVGEWRERTWHFRRHVNGLGFTFIGDAGIWRLYGPDTSERDRMIETEDLTSYEMVIFSARILEGDGVPRFVVGSSVFDILNARDEIPAPLDPWADVDPAMTLSFADAILLRATATATARAAREAMAEALPPLVILDILKSSRQHRLADLMPSTTWWDIHAGTFGPTVRPWERNAAA